MTPTDTLIADAEIAVIGLRDMDQPWLAEVVDRLLARVRELEAGLTWTDAKPTVPGWYWFRTDADCEPTVSYYDTKNWFGREWMAQLDGQFAGPIPTPKETPAK